VILELPGLVDVHVHLRQPGAEHKEDIRSGSAAALAGGVTMLLDMPNTSPPLVDSAALDRKRAMVEQRALCDVGCYIGATETNAREAALLADQTPGLKIYLDQTYGPLRMRSLAALLAHFRAWPTDRPIAVHAEGLSAAVAIGLAQSFGQRLHLCHVSRADEIALVRAAKVAGAALTCEVTPHHLFLTEADAKTLGSYGAMRPPLASSADVAALWANLDIVDCIATDHAPHNEIDKQVEFDHAPPGMIGLETAFAHLHTELVTTGEMELVDLVRSMTAGPARALGIRGGTLAREEPADLVLFDPGEEWTLEKGMIRSRSKNTPLVGKRFVGRVQGVFVEGKWRSSIIIE
jgi:carbamoyl-phosphate synthase/aspartate carbamoyltransferase/dihydroorotase